MNYVLAFLMFGFLTWVIVLIRNTQVFKYRQKIIHNISERDLVEIRANGRPLVERWQIYNSVSYEKMVFRFWKPLDSFYPSLDVAKQQNHASVEAKDGTEGKDETGQDAR